MDCALLSASLIFSKNWTDAFRQRGVFNVTALTNDAAAILESFVLKVDWRGVKADIPMRKRRSSKPPVWVKFFQSLEGEMAYLGNEFFDDILRAQ